MINDCISHGPNGFKVEKTTITVFNDPPNTDDMVGEGEKQEAIDLGL